MQNIDKLAIGAAVLFILGGLAFPYIMEPAPDLSKLEELTTDAVTKAGDQEIPAITDSPVLEKVRSVHGVDNSVAFLEWSMYRRPARIKTWMPHVEKPPVHEVGTVTEVKSRRDEELMRPVLDIEVKIGNIERASLIAADIQIQDKDGKWVTKTSVMGGSGQTRQATLDELPLGHHYLVRLLTRVRPEKPNMNGFPTEQVSEPAGQPIWLPVDQSWKISSITNLKVGANGVEPAKATIVREFWDYEKDKAKSVREFQIPFTEISGWKQRKGVCGTEYKLYQISGFTTGKTPFAELRDASRKLPNLRILKGAEPLNMETETWKAPEPVMKEEGDDGEMTEEPQDSGASSEEDDDDDDFFDDPDD